ncbi:MAG: dTDP-4-dehydrorhamnose 3,5-epimerase [Pseudomonadota bacterium]
MKVIETPLNDVFIIEPKIFGDDRGFFFESFNLEKFHQLTGVKDNFVQDNHSKSQQSVLRGLHYQTQQTQGKLVRVIEGEIYDVVVDLRQKSSTFGQIFGLLLDAKKHQQLWVPKGFAHGFVVTSKQAQVLYKTTDYYAPEYEQSINWNDKDLGIPWPLNGKTPLLSAKDNQGSHFKDAHYFA